MKASEANIQLERDMFLRQSVREIFGVLEDTVGLEQAKGYISVVGQNIGAWLNQEYRHAMHCEKLNLAQVAEVLVDFKARIHGGFYVISMDEEKLVLGNTRCPFREQVVDRVSWCMMTSNIFGTIAAENLGYAKVCLHKTIARGNKECCVVIYLNPDNPEAIGDEGNEYYCSE